MSTKLFEYGRNFFVCQDFVSIKKEGPGRRKDKKFRFLEVRRKLIAL
jgi:hypothetical protein